MSVVFIYTIRGQHQAFQVCTGRINNTLKTLANLAVSFHAAGRRPEALALRRESLAIIDRMAESLKALTRDERSTALAQYQGYYSRFARDLSEDAADFPEAFNVTERGKARSLLEELIARQAIASSGIPADSTQRLVELRSHIEHLDGKLASAADDQTHPLRVERDATRDEYVALHRSLMSQYPRYASLSAVRPISIDEGRALLPASGVFVSWLFDNNESGVALVLPQSGELKVRQAEPGKAMLLRAETYRWLHALPDSARFAQALREVPLAAWEDDGELYIAAPARKPAEAKPVTTTTYDTLRAPALAAQGQWLVDTLLKPFAADIDTAEQWILAPDGILATLPWDTLPWQGKPLGLQKQITVIQSLSVYALLKEREANYAKERTVTKSADSPLLAMGGATYSPDAATRCGVRGAGFQRAPNVVIAPSGKTTAEQQHQDAYRDMLSLQWPNLPCTENEVVELHALMGGSTLIGDKASETALRTLSQNGELAQYRNLHFAAHGYLNTSFPDLSALVLTRTGTDEANDGYITAGEWPAFNLKSDLMVLSACETALGKVVSGEGVQGLPYALYVAGNRDTLLSLWQVDDAGTAVFMKRFWAKLKNGMSHARALAETKREMARGMDGDKYSDPYYWAPFVLYGLQG